MTTPTADTTIAATVPDAVTPAPGEPELLPERRRRRKLIALLLLLLAFLILLGIAIWYLLFRQPINVLPGIPGQVVMPNYVTSIQGATRPLGVASTADGGLIYVGETSGDRIARAFTAGGQQQGLLQPPVSTGTEHVPVYLAVDPKSGDVYVTDRPRASIYMYGSDGTYKGTLAVPAGLTGWQPLAIAFDPAGNLYVSDVSVNPQTVIEIGRDGKVIRTLGATESMSYPNGIALDAAGNVYVADSNNGRLLVFGLDGQVLARVGRGASEGNLGMPRGVVVDDKGKVYVADASGQNVTVYEVLKQGEARLKYLGFFGSQGLGDGQFEFPNGLSLDTRGRIYVADSGNNRVQVWSY